MKKLLYFLPIALIAACQSTSPSTALSNELTNASDSISYGIGVNIGKNLGSANFGELNPDQIAAGIRDILDSNETKLDDQQIQAMMQAQQMKEQKQEMAAAEGYKLECETWMAANATKDGVQTTPSGLQYKVITQGEGAVPTMEDKVSVHYTGTLIDGTKFDSSVDRGQPAEFGVTQVIKGWTEALTMMPVGSKYQLFIPAELAYGEQVRPGGPIPANAALIFDVELLDIVTE